MCWMMLSKKKPQMKVAKKGIKVFKVVYPHCHDTFVSLYARHFYNTGKEYHLEGELGVVDLTYSANKYCILVQEGFHSYSPKMGLYEHRSGDSVSIAHGSPKHCYSSIPEEWQYLTVIECIIPKGSSYYYNPNNGEYVSDAIRVVQEGDIESYRIK